MRKFDEFIVEKFHTNQHVKHLTKLIYDKINLFIPNLIRNNKIEIKNLLQDNYIRIKFEDDIIIVNLGKNHGGINKPVYNDNIKNLNINLTISLDNKELISKKMINNKIRETINHELQHVLEFYYTNGDLSKSWSFDERLKEHQSKFKSYEKWLEICHIFYLMEDHELRSRISQCLELLKNNKDSENLESVLYNSDIYKSLDFISKINGNLILKVMNNNYKDFNIILSDFIKNVLLKSPSSNRFISEINNINKKSIKSKNKLLRVLYSYQNPDSFLEEYIEKDIDFRDYL